MPCACGGKRGTTYSVSVGGKVIAKGVSEAAAGILARKNGGVATPEKTSVSK